MDPRLRYLLLAFVFVAHSVVLGADPVSGNANPAAAFPSPFSSTVSFPTPPVVKQIVQPDLTQSGQSTTQPSPPTFKAAAAACGIPLYDARFNGPANFPLPKFGLCGEPHFDDGLVIHEGMSLLVAATGHYEVSFTTSAPDIPVTLRIQLVLGDQLGRHLTLTLLPIVISPDRYFTGNYLGDPYQVTLRGYSKPLGLLFPSLCNQSVIRQGTARFGSWPEGSGDFPPFQKNSEN